MTSKPTTTPSVQTTPKPDLTQAESALGHAWPPVWPAYDKVRFPDGILPYA